MIFSRVSKGQKSKKEKKDAIKWRGKEVLRIEAFSDAIFAFAITLLVVSLEVPKNFEELLEMLKGFIPFSVCFALFFQVWVEQNLFFRRFGLHDERTIMLNAMLLFSMLFFVYPLKFLWTVLLNYNAVMKDPHDMVVLMYIYGCGFAAIYFLFALMYTHAYKKRYDLQLSDSEVFETKTYIFRNIGTGMVGLASIAVASLGPKFVAVSGMMYALIGLQIGLTHSRRGKIFRKKFPAAQTADHPGSKPGEEE